MNDILREIQEHYGWTDDTLITHLGDFLVEFGQMDEAEEFLEKIGRRENGEGDDD